MTAIPMAASAAMNIGGAGDLTITPGGTLLATNVVDLFTAPAGYVPGAPITEYTLANYVGYAAEVVTWGPPTRADDGSTELIGQAGEFRPTDATTPNNVTGFLHRDAGGAILHGGTFDGTGISMASALDSLIVVLRVRPTFNGVAEVIS